MPRGQGIVVPPSVAKTSQYGIPLNMGGVTELTGRTAPKYLFQILRGLGTPNIFPVTENLIPVGSVTGNADD